MWQYGTVIKCPEVSLKSCISNSGPSSDIMLHMTCHIVHPVTMRQCDL